MVSLEHRKNNRILFSIPAQYKIFQLENLEKDVLNDELALKAAIEDMSMGGIQVVSEAPFREGDILELELSIPSVGKARTIAKVVWSREESTQGRYVFRSGIQFIPVYEDDLKKVKAYFDNMGETE